MKNIIIWSGILGFCFLVFGFQNNDQIYWNKSKKLIWDDFKGKPDKISKNSAMAHTGIKTNFAYENDVLEATVQSYFRKDRSWVKKHFLNSMDGLKHEQGHFNITEIYARRMRKELLEKSFALKNVQKEFKSIYQKNSKN